MNKDIIEKRSFIDVQKLQDAYGLNNLIGELGNWWYNEGVGQDTFITVDIESLEAFFLDFDYGDEHIEENPDLYKVYLLMKSGELPEEFILLIWW